LITWIRTGPTNLVTPTKKPATSSTVGRDWLANIGKKSTNASGFCLQRNAVLQTSWMLRGVLSGI
jgi:hypothetical protein